MNSAPSKPYSPVARRIIKNLHATRGALLNGSPLDSHTFRHTINQLKSALSMAAVGAISVEEAEAIIHVYNDIEEHYDA